MVSHVPEHFPASKIIVCDWLSSYYRGARQSVCCGLVSALLGGVLSAAQAGGCCGRWCRSPEGCIVGIPACLGEKRKNCPPAAALGAPSAILCRLSSSSWCLCNSSGITSAVRNRILGDGPVLSALLTFLRLRQHRFG